MKNHYYNVHGLTICSEIDLPELVTVKEHGPDVWIRIGHVPDHLPIINGSGVLYEAAQDDFLLKLDSIAKYRVQTGKYITIDSKASARPEEVRLFLFGSAMGALLHQRGMLAMHASSVKKGGKGFLIAGTSASGKSTLSAGLLKKGYSIISDDISVIALEKEIEHFIYPGMPHLKLWKDVLVHMNENLNLEKVRPMLEKYKKPTIPGKKLNPVKLDKIVVLSTKNTPGYYVEEVHGFEKFNLLRQNVYRIQFVDKLCRIESNFKNLSKLATETKVFLVKRPLSPLKIWELAIFVEDNIFVS